MALELVSACCLVVSIVAVTVGSEVQPGDSSSANTTLEKNQQDEATPPAHSMHRLNPSVLDTSLPPINSSTFSPGNVTDGSPFLPSGITPSYMSSQRLLVGISNSSKNHPNANFTPSFFIGEVLPEPYVPERFQTPTYRTGRNSSGTSRSYQYNEPSQPIPAANMVLPFIEKMKHAAAFRSTVQNFANDHGYFPEYVPPVHEPSTDDSTTHKYETQYGDYDQHSDRPYHFHTEYQSLMSTKPITFEDNQEDHNSQAQDQDHSLHQQHGSSGGGHYDHGGSYEGQKSLHDDHPKPYRGYHHHGGWSDNAEQLPHQSLDNPHQSHHHETDLVLPSPFYPPEPEHPTSHHKGVLYKVYQHKPKSPLKGLLHLAATLIPLGLFVAALQPSIIHINSSHALGLFGWTTVGINILDRTGRGCQVGENKTTNEIDFLFKEVRLEPMIASFRPMPGKQRSLEGDYPVLPGLEALERLGLERLDNADCERKAFCELAVLGSRPQASGAQQGLWKLANSIPEQYADTLGLSEMLKAVKSSSCSALKCGTSNQISEATPSNT